MLFGPSLAEVFKLEKVGNQMLTVFYNLLSGLAVQFNLISTPVVL